jgi:cytochrome c oxidase subunit 3
MPHAEHFQSIGQQAHAARFGMWVFLGSELLLFAALFTLYAAYRIEYPTAFAQGVASTDLLLGSLNTLVLLTSSFFVVLGVHALREGHIDAWRWVAATVGLGALFLVFKAIEYTDHFEHGLFPGRGGASPGVQMFWTLYYGMTGLHALHVMAGMIVLTVMAHGVRGQTIGGRFTYVLENGANYWHLVDIVWLFLWPMFYLMRGT